MHALLRQLLGTARVKQLFPTPGLVVVAVSGGPDSTALLHALGELSGTLGLELLIAHLDHGLRGEEAAGDAAAVGELAGAMGLPVEVGVRKVEPSGGRTWRRRRVTPATTSWARSRPASVRRTWPSVTRPMIRPRRCS